MTQRPKRSCADTMLRVAFGKCDDLIIVAPHNGAGATRPQFGHPHPGFRQQPADITGMADMLCRRVAKPADPVAVPAPGCFRQAGRDVEPFGEPRQFSAKLGGNPAWRLWRSATGISGSEKPGMCPRIGGPIRRDKTDKHRSSPRNARVHCSVLERVRGSAPRQLGARVDGWSLAIWRSHEHDTLTDRLVFERVVNLDQGFGSTVRISG